MAAVNNLRWQQAAIWATLVMAIAMARMMTISGGQSSSSPSETVLSRLASSLKMYVEPLPEIPKLLAYKPPSAGNPNPTPAPLLTIAMYPILWKFHRDLPPTPVFAYGTSAATATVPGPLIEAIQGIPTSITWENHLPDTHILPWDPTITTAIPKTGGVPTVVHLHGGIQSPDTDGHALAWFTANFKETGPAWNRTTYTYPNIQYPGNLWYHDHAPGLTRVNLLAGLIGPYVIKDPVMDASHNLPSGPEFDRYLMIFDRSFNVDGSIYMNRTGDNPTIHPQWQPEYFGDAIIVNGKAWPYLPVQRRKYRFRITNASNARFFRFALSNGLRFVVIGSDASYLSSPVTTSRFLLAPSESIDVVIDFSLSESDECLLTNNAPYPYPTGDVVDHLNSKVMKFIISPRGPNTPDVSKIPSTLKIYATKKASEAAKDALTRRYITLYEYESATGDPIHLYINGKRFLDPATETPRSGTTEVWEVINLTEDNHPLHIHLAKYQAIKARRLVDADGFKACMTIKNDAIACNVTGQATGRLLSIPKYERTWKNVVKMEPGYMTTVVVKFNMVDYDAPYPFDATAEPGYAYHCHILDHEDNEMIRPLKLLP